MSTLRNYCVAPKLRATKPELNTRQRIAKARRTLVAIETTIAAMDDLPEWSKAQTDHYEALTQEHEALNAWISKDCEGDLV